MGFEGIQDKMVVAMEAERAGEKESQAPEPIEKDLPDTEKEQPKITDLDSLERFRFDGKEWTPKDLRNAYLMQSDYTQKTKALAEERRFAENFAADYRAVVQNPDLIESFKEIYPKKYHAYIEGIVAQNENKPDVAQNRQQPVQAQIPAEFSKTLEEMKAWKNQMETTQFEKEVSAIEAQLGTIFTDMRKKYPLANEEAVIARAQALIDKKYSVDDKVWNELWKSGHEMNKKTYDTVYKTQLTKQKDANAKGTDVGAGGGIPGQAPKKMTFKEATEAAIQAFSSRS